MLRRARGDKRNTIIQICKYNAQLILAKLQLLAFNLIFVGMKGNNKFISLKSQDISYAKALLEENVQIYRGKPNISTSSSKSSNNKLTIETFHY